VGLALLYADASAVHLLAWDGASHRLASLADNGAGVCIASPRRPTKS
jgi:hypothetical protein